MNINANINLHCPSGFYCMRNGEKKCVRLHFQSNRPYCEVFYPFLDTDRYGNVLKCEPCLMAEREARLEK